MELPHIGTHCSVRTCRQLDFLPIECNLCKKEFCTDHHMYESHNCTESYKADVQVPICPLCNQAVPSKRGQPPDLAVNDHMENNCKNKKKKIYTNKCSAVRCKTKEVVPVLCDSCKKNFCLQHRHVVDHDCKGPSSGRERALVAATTRLSNNKKQGGGSTSRDHSGGSKSSQGILRFVAPVDPKPTTRTQPVRTTNLSTLQGGLSEDEALARALANSVQDKKGDQSVPPAGSDHLQEDEDAQFARAIAASMEPNPRPANSHQQNSNSCTVC